MHPNERERASFLKENFLPLYQSGRMQWVDVEQDVVFAPGFRVRFVYGHTEAMMLPLLDTPDGPLLYCADLLPSQWHLSMPWVMAYDIRPLQTLAEKQAILEEAAEKGYLLFLEHDPVTAVIKVQKDARGRFVVADF